MDTTILIYALSRSDSEAGRIISGNGLSHPVTDNTQIDKRVECVVLPGDRRSGISCDWANATKETDN